MKIIINALSARRGGGQTYLINLLNHLDCFPGNKIYILAPDSLTFPTDSRIDRIETTTLTVNPVFRAVYEKLILPRLVRELDADILFSPGGLLGREKYSKCKTVTMFRNMIPFDPKIRCMYPFGYMRLRNWLLKRAMLRSMQRADLVIFISEFAKNVIEREAHGKLANNVIIPHGITENFKVTPSSAPVRPSWLPTSEYLLYVSFLDVYKKQLEIVQGYYLLKQMRPTSEKLVLAGHNSSQYAETVRKEIHSLGLDNDVILTGNITYAELPGVYYHSKVNIFASVCENCPNILLEALGAGRPLLVSNVLPMPEFSGESVEYFDPTSPQDFAGKLFQIIDDADVLKRMSAQSSARARQFNWKDTAKRTWAALEDLCKQ